MGARGPGRKPAKLKLLNSEDGRDSGGRRVPLPPKFIRQAPPKPEDLSEEAAAYWDAIVADLEPLDLLKAADGPALATLCELHVDQDRVTALLRQAGYLVKQPSGRIANNPLLDARIKLSAEIRAWSQRFGVTSSGEMNLASERPRDDGNPFAPQSRWG